MNPKKTTSSSDTKKKPASKKAVRKSAKQNSAQKLKDLRSKLEMEFAEKEAAWAEKEDQLMRSLAEKENVLRRRERSMKLESSQRKGDLVLPLLGVLDDLERALVQEESGGESLREGVQLVHRRLQELMGDMGVEIIEAEGKSFDPHFHEALMQIPSEEEKGKIIQEIQRGYLLDGRLLRPSKVAVAGE
ncbi:MAG: nucleotide exchange factor GrpE [Candidatus Krumholzibacteria bacterium]|nr:nucleotide exchange factor GrpE [Candidatus Krumholzibacteria bacterium]MDP6796795.1 nucleotide exchange factor GrpE [Candidatus Krumholzibacteria bacterium]